MQIIENKLSKTFLEYIKKCHYKYNNLAVFEPKDPLRVCYGTEVIHLSQPATFI